MAQTRQALEIYLSLLDDAFAGPEWHSLLSNLATVAPEDWTWVPPGGERSIRSIVRHIGYSKLVAYDQAFGGGTLTWDDVSDDGKTTDITSAIAWLRMGPERLRGGIAALADDDELLRPLAEFTNHISACRACQKVRAQDKRSGARAADGKAPNSVSRLARLLQKRADIDAAIATLGATLNEAEQSAAHAMYRATTTQE